MNEKTAELAQRCRPTTLSEVWGNLSAKKDLENNMRKGDTCPQSFLFIGPAGCGKTTLARVFCHDMGMNDADIEEINASNANGVDDIRELEARIKYRGLSERKAYILDEVHQLTPQAQSAALKMLEEPPTGVFFCLCTTDPHKLTKTIKDRCVEIRVQPLPEDDLRMELMMLCKREGIKASLPVLNKVCEKAEGTPRVALKLLDSVSDLDDATAFKILEQKGLIGEDEDPDTKMLCQMLLKPDKHEWKEYAAILGRIKGNDAEKVRRMVLGYMSSVLLNSGNPYAAVVLQYFEDSFFNSGFPGLVLATYSALDELKSM